MRNLFRVHHPISLTDALAAVFRPKAKKPSLARIPIGPGRELDRMELPVMQTPSMKAPVLELVENSGTPEQTVTAHSMR